MKTSNYNTTQHHDQLGYKRLIDFCIWKEKKRIVEQDVEITLTNIAVVYISEWKAFFGKVNIINRNVSFLAVYGKAFRLYTHKAVRARRTSL